MTARVHQGTARWCPHHDNEIKRGTKRCRSCPTDLPIPPRPTLMVKPELLRQMRLPGQSTKRAERRWRKGGRVS